MRTVRPLASRTSRCPKGKPWNRRCWSLSTASCFWTTTIPYDYVIEMLQKIFIFTLDQAYRHAEEVDRAGRTVLITCELREAEFARDQIHAYGPDWRLPRSKGSMSAIVEPEPPHKPCLHP